MMRTLSLIFILMSAVLLMAGFISQETWLTGGLILLMAVAWVYAETRPWPGLTNLGLGLFLAAGIWGVMVGLHTAWVLSSVTFALLAWDLVDFQRRLLRLSPSVDRAMMEKKHIGDLALLGVSVAVFYLLTVFLTLKISLGWVIVLAVCFAILLQQVYRKSSQR